VGMHGWRQLRRTGIMAAVVAGLLLVVATTPPAFAQTGLQYQVIDADGADDGGVYYRNSPRWDDTARITGVGGFYGETVELICYAWGESVGPFENRVWHFVTNVSRPSAGQGWLPDRYLNTPVLANELVPGEPECGASQPPPTPPPPSLPGGGSLYYSPYNGSNIGAWWNPRYVPSPATLTLDRKQWYRGRDCSAGYAVPNLNGSYGGKLITTLAGWSYGRNGPIMFLAAKPPWWTQVNYILLFDPGSMDEYYTGVCDTKYPQKSALLADWLARDASNRLVVLAGRTTADYEHRVNGRGHAGIQNRLFQDIRTYPRLSGRSIRSQVVVCNYDGMSHKDVWINFRHRMNAAPITRSTCPRAEGYRRVTSWNP
jgi:hypothetical protein